MYTYMYIWSYTTWSNNVFPQSHELSITSFPVTSIRHPISSCWLGESKKLPKTIILVFIQDLSNSPGWSVLCHNPLDLASLVLGLQVYTPWRSRVLFWCKGCGSPASGLPQKLKVLMNNCVWRKQKPMGLKPSLVIFANISLLISSL